MIHSYDTFFEKFNKTQTELWTHKCAFNTGHPLTLH